MSDAPGGFWTRRRAQVAAEEAAEARALAEAEERAAEKAEEQRLAAEQADKSDAEILAEFGLPDPDALIPGQDIAGFMQKAVPRHLRRRALRRLWRLNPALAVLDGLNDYDGDFTNAATDAPGVRTSYRVGQGLLRHVEALAKAEADKVAQDRTTEDGAIENGNVADVAVPSGDMAQVEDKIAAELADIPERPASSGNSARLDLLAQKPDDAASASATKVVVSAPSIGEKIEPEPTDPPPARRMRFTFEPETE